jgi:hypothetical protein
VSLSKPNTAHDRKKNKVSPYALEKGYEEIFDLYQYVFKKYTRPINPVSLLARQVPRGAWFRPKVSTDSATSDQIRASWVNAARL